MPKTREASRSLHSVTVLPEDLNQYGSLFGGRLLAWIDRLASICATRHCRGHAVTVALEAMRPWQERRPTLPKAKPAGSAPPCSPSWPWTGMGAPRRCPP